MATLTEVNDLLKELHRRDEYNRVHSRRDTFDQRLIDALEDLKKQFDADEAKAPVKRPAVTRKPSK